MCSLAGINVLAIGILLITLSVAFTKLLFQRATDLLFGKKYQYASLPSSHSIRILKVHPGSRDDPIKYSLIFADVYHAPEYVALSYVWGYTNNPREILLRGAQFFVGINLSDALQKVRQPQEIWLMWIHAICIYSTSPQ